MRLEEKERADDCLLAWSVIARAAAGRESSPPPPSSAYHTKVQQYTKRSDIIL